MNRDARYSKIYIAVIILLMYLPIMIVIAYSFNESKISAVWGGFSLKWYKELLLDRAVMQSLKNSLILATVSSLNSAILGTLGALGLSKLRFKGKKLLDYFINIPIMTPEIILGIAFLTFFTMISISFGFLPLMIAHTSFGVPYVYMLVKARLVGLDESFVEAAKDLGASNTKAFFDVTLPALTPSIFSGVLLSFAMSMDDVVISNFLTGPSFNTLPVKIYSQLKTTVSPKYNALCTLMFLATVFVVIVVVIIENKKSKNSFEEVL